MNKEPFTLVVGFHSTRQSPLSDGRAVFTTDPNIELVLYDDSNKKVLPNSEVGRQFFEAEIGIAINSVERSGLDCDGIVKHISIDKYDLHYYYMKAGSEEERLKTFKILESLFERLQ